MLILKMCWVAARLAWPHLLAPWSSPLVRWRLETFGVTDASGRLLHAGDITPAVWIRFLRAHHATLRRFLRWAATL